MKLLFDFFPILLFFVTFKTAGLMAATIVIMVATLLQVGIHWLKHRKAEPMHLISLGFVLLLGMATVILKDERFIKWKPTLAYVVMAGVFAGSHFVGSKKPLIERVAGKSLTLPVKVWNRLNVSWVVFFLVLAVLNIAVASHFSTETWVNFKLFGLLGLTLAFALGQGLVMSRHGAEKKETTGESKT